MKKSFFIVSFLFISLIIVFFTFINFQSIYSAGLKYYFSSDTHKIIYYIPYKNDYFLIEDFGDEISIKNVSKNNTIIIYSIKDKNRILNYENFLKLNKSELESYSIQVYEKVGILFFNPIDAYRFEKINDIHILPKK